MTKAPKALPDRYAAAGVKLDTAEEAKRRIAELVRGTRTPLARGAVGGFGGMVRVPDGYKNPVLVMSTVGVGLRHDADAFRHLSSERHRRTYPTMSAKGLSHLVALDQRR